MKISFIINEPVQDANGGYKMVYMYANSLVHSGHDVSIYYLCRKGRLFTNYRMPFGVKLEVARFLARKGPKWFSLDKKVNGIVITKISNETINNADAVIATAVNTALPVSKLNANKGEKAYFIQDFENWEISDEEVYDTYALGMKNIVVSKWLKEIVDKYSKEEAIVVSNGIDTNIFYNKNHKRKKHSIVLQYRKKAYKGPEYAMETIKKLNTIYPDLSVSIISVDTPPVDLPSCCIYYQSITPEKVAEINNTCSVFMCTSIKEGYGLPGLEAMACGCVVCSSGYKGVFEYAENEINSLISPVKDSDEMVKNICRAFEDDALRNRIIENAILTGKEKSQEKMAALFESILIS